MVTLRFLVPSFKVRVLVGQQNPAIFSRVYLIFYMCLIGSILILKTTSLKVVFNLKL